MFQSVLLLRRHKQARFESSNFILQSVCALAVGYAFLLKRILQCFDLNMVFHVEKGSTRK